MKVDKSGTEAEPNIW